MATEEKEFIISYETVFDLLKRERERADLQKLDPGFISFISGYISEKNKEHAASEQDDSKKNLERLIENIKKLMADLSARREKKIMGLALDKSRSKSTIVDMECFLPEERMLFDEIVKILDTYREGVLSNILMGRMPVITKTDSAITISIRQEQPKADKQTTKLVRFLSPLPRFVGQELEEYGPFAEDDIANLPIIIAELLIAKERAEEIVSK